MEETKITTLEEQINTVVDEYIILIGQIKDKETRIGFITRFLDVLFDTSVLIHDGGIKKEDFIKQGIDNIEKYLKENLQVFSAVKTDLITGH